MKKISVYITGFITALLFFFTVVIIVFTFFAAKNNKIITIFGYSFAVVATNSMEPTINVRDIVINKKVDFDKIKKEDIIVYYSESYDIYIVHRVVSVLPDGKLQTKGDNPMSDIDPEAVTAEDYHSKVIKYGNFFGLGNLLINNRHFTYLLIVIALLLIVLIEFITIINAVISKKRHEFRKKM